MRVKEYLMQAAAFVEFNGCTGRPNIAWAGLLFCRNGRLQRLDLAARVYEPLELQSRGLFIRSCAGALLIHSRHVDKLEHTVLMSRDLQKKPGQ